MTSLFKTVTINDDRFKKFRDRVDKLSMQEEEKKNQLQDIIERKRILKKKYNDSLKAQALIQKVAKETQQKLEYHIGNVVTMAQAAVFPDPYGFELEFVERRGKTECDIWFVKDGERMEPMFSSGGGALDIASFALRCAFWSLKRTRSTIILDEPMKFLSRDLQDKASEMIKMLSEKLGLQFIIVSHIDELISSADKVFRVSQEKGISKVEEVN